MQAIQPYGPPITLSKAKKIAEVAEAEAVKNGWSMVIAVLDSACQVVLLQRMDHAQHASVAIAQAKAKTAVNFKRSTKVYEDAVAQGGLGLRILTIEGICAIDGGLPITEGGAIIGGIGVSGAQPQQDAAVAAAALAALAA